MDPYMIEMLCQFIETCFYYIEWTFSWLCMRWIIYL